MILILTSGHESTLRYYVDLLLLANPKTNHIKKLTEGRATTALPFDIYELRQPLFTCHCEERSDEAIH